METFQAENSPRFRTNAYEIHRQWKSKPEKAFPTVFAYEEQVTYLTYSPNVSNVNRIFFAFAFVILFVVHFVRVISIASYEFRALSELQYQKYILKQVCLENILKTFYFNLQ